jgi:hypothetical protein
MAELQHLRRLGANDEGGFLHAIRSFDISRVSGWKRHSQSFILTAIAFSSQKVLR